MSVWRPEPMAGGPSLIYSSCEQGKVCAGCIESLLRVADGLAFCLLGSLRGCRIRGGYAEAKAARLLPRKGSQAVRILRPQVQKGSDTSDSGAAQESENGDSLRVSYRPVPVFNAADLVGPGLDELIAQCRGVIGPFTSPRQTKSACRPEPPSTPEASSAPSTNARCRFRTSDILLVRQALYR